MCSAILRISVTRRWRDLEPGDGILLAFMGGLGFLWGVIALAVPPFSVASWGSAVKVLVYLALWPATLSTVITVEAEQALGIHLPFPILPPLLGAVGGLLAGVPLVRLLSR